MSCGTLQQQKNKCCACSGSASDMHGQMHTILESLQLTCLGTSDLLSINQTSCQLITAWPYVILLFCHHDVLVLSCAGSHNLNLSPSISKTGRRTRFLVFLGVFYGDSVRLSPVGANSALSRYVPVKAHVLPDRKFVSILFPLAFTLCPFVFASFKLLHQLMLQDEEMVHSFFELIL